MINNLFNITHPSAYQNRQLIKFFILPDLLGVFKSLIAGNSFIIPRPTFTFYNTKRLPILENNNIKSISFFSAGRRTDRIRGNGISRYLKPSINIMMPERNPQGCFYFCLTMFRWIFNSKHRIEILTHSTRKVKVFYPLNNPRYINIYYFISGVAPTPPTLQIRKGIESDRLRYSVTI